MAKTNVPPPPDRSQGTKGEPPTRERAPGNLERDDYSGETVNLNFTVPKEFRHEFKLYAIQQGKSMIDVLYEAYEMHRKKYE